MEDVNIGEGSVRARHGILGRDGGGRGEERRTPQVIK